MLHLTLNRTEDTGNETIGELRVEGKPELEGKVFHTIERPWKDNENDVSCIPAGTYQFVPHGWEEDSTAHMKQVWELQEVPNREGVLIHAGNTVKDVIGCIAVGLITGEIDGHPACLESQQAIALFREYIGENSGTITIL